MKVTRRRHRFTVEMSSRMLEMNERIEDRSLWLRLSLRRYFRTYIRLPPTVTQRSCERVIEEKHFDVGGVCRLDVHFALGQAPVSAPKRSLKSSFKGGRPRNRVRFASMSSMSSDFERPALSEPEALL